jgi:hypothetical protein
MTALRCAAMVLAVVCLLGAALAATLGAEAMLARSVPPAELPAITSASQGEGAFL